MKRVRKTPHETNISIGGLGIPVKRYTWSHFRTTKKLRQYRRNFFGMITATFSSFIRRRYGQELTGKLGFFPNFLFCAELEKDVRSCWDSIEMATLHKSIGDKRLRSPFSRKCKTTRASNSKRACQMRCLPIQMA